MVEIDQFEDLRSKLVEAVNQFGLNSPLVLDLSQQLDNLHNQYNDFTYNSLKE